MLARIIHQKSEEIATQGAALVALLEESEIHEAQAEMSIL